ncbi:DUF6128 domain-containing protein [Lachnospiraceae bacterium ZAX-1]
MSGFQRFITYLNLYEENQKIRNTGFAKIEKRNDQCKVEIHMRGTGYTGISCPVYLYTLQREKPFGIQIGEIQMQNSVGDFHASLSSANLNNSGYDFEEMNGIIIKVNDKFMFASQWDDKEIMLNQFRIAEKGERMKTKDNMEIQLKAAEYSGGHDNSSRIEVLRETGYEQNSKSNEVKPEDLLSTEKQKNEGQQSDAQIEQQLTMQKQEQIDMQEKKLQPAVQKQSTMQERRQPAMQKQEQPTIQKELQPTMQKQEQPTIQKELQSTMQKKLQQTTEQVARMQDTKVKQMPQRNTYSRNNIKGMEAARQPFPEELSPEELFPEWAQKWQFILENYPVMTPFEDEETILCVRMELKDIRMLPKRYWYLGNNSFLLHGFFNYRYLLLGAMKEGGEKKWFIGIPGVYQSQEKVMATLFGFPEFKCEKKSDHKTDHFGYWYRIIDE